MDRIWFGMGALVAAVAGVKTLLVTQFILQPGQANPAMIAALFALFLGMTAAVAYVAVAQLQRRKTPPRRERLAPPVAEAFTKETVIARYAPDWGLSQAEADVAIFAAKGFSNNEIAEMRGCALATVKSQLSKIYQKSGLGSRYQLIAFVTDEAVSAATESAASEEAAAPQQPVQTRKILPLVGRSTRTRGLPVGASEPVPMARAQSGR